MTNVEYQSRVPATLPRGTKVKVTDTGDGVIQHVNVDSLMSPAIYHSSPFGGIRVAADFLVMDHLHLYPGSGTAYDPDVYGYEADGGGVGTITHLPNESAMRMSVSNGTNGAKSRLRTHDRVRYQSGAATHIKITGYASNGDLYSVIRSSATGSVVETKTLQTGWNQDASAVDVTTGNIFEIMYQWLGVGDVWYFVNGGIRHIVHNHGTQPRPYMKSANLPLSFEVVNDGATQYIRFGQFDDEDGVYFEIQRASGAGSLTHICSSARILNGLPPPTASFGFTRALTGVSTTLIPLFSMRMNATLNGIASRVFALPDILSCFAETREGAFVLVLDPSLTGATWAAVSPSGAVQFDTAASAMSGGTEIARVSLPADSFQAFVLSSVFTIPGRKIRRKAFTGTSDVLTVGVIREGTVNFNPRATLNWQEVR